MSVADEPKIDCHVHVFDPDVVPYGAGTLSAPAGQEMGSRIGPFVAKLALSYPAGHPNLESRSSRRAGVRAGLS